MKNRNIRNCFVNKNLFSPTMHKRVIWMRTDQPDLKKCFLKMMENLIFKKFQFHSSLPNYRNNIFTQKFRSNDVRMF